MSPNTISEAQLNANRQNAQSSTGPRSDDAKQRTRLNGLRHGLTGHTILMPYEDAEAFQTFSTETIAGLQPATFAEQALAQTIANDSWRLSRARAIEENIFALGLETANITSPEDAALNQAMTFLGHAREIQLLSLYAGRIARGIDKARRELETLQAERRHLYNQALEEEILLAELDESKGRIHQPEENGFGFSTSQIHQIIHRRHRLLAACQLAKSSAPPMRKAA